MSMINSPIVFHVPHACTRIPPGVRRTLCLSPRELRTELLRLTDHYTDELFRPTQFAATSLVYPVSRIVVDPERFVSDADEPASRYGLGVVYTRTSDGRSLRPDLTPGERQRLIRCYYWPHHAALHHLIASTLDRHGWCLIIDAHSFPSTPLPHETGQCGRRPDICLGTDSYHTPPWLVDLAAGIFTQAGWDVAVNSPFEGSIVPSGLYHREPRVFSIMIELNRRLYMDETSGAKSGTFSLFRRALQDALRLLTAESAHAARLRTPRGDSNAPHRGTSFGPAGVPFYCRPGACRIHPTTRRSA